MRARVVTIGSMTRYTLATMFPAFLKGEEGCPGPFKPMVVTGALATRGMFVGTTKAVHVEADSATRARAAKGRRTIGVEI